MEINWEAIADDIVRQLEGSPEFKQFCDDQLGAFDDRMHEAIEEKFVDPIIAENFKFGESAEGDENHFEFAMNMTYGLIHALNKYYVTQYLGRKW